MSNPSISDSAPHSKNMLPNQQAPPPLASSSTPSGPKESTPSQPSRTMTRQKKMTLRKRILSLQKKAAPNQRISRISLDLRRGQKKIRPTPRSNPAAGQESTPSQPSRTMTRQKKMTLRKRIPSLQKKAAPNQRISRVSLDLRRGQKKIRPTPRSNPSISDSAPHSKKMLPNQQAPPPLASSSTPSGPKDSTPNQPSSSTPRKKITPSQQEPQPKSNPTSSKMKISPNQQTSPLLSNSMALQDKTTSQLLITSVTNSMKRKPLPPFSPPGGLFSLNTTEPPHKKAKTAFQGESLNQRITTSVERYFSQPLDTLTESRELFMKDTGSSAIYDFFLQNQQSEALLMKKQNLTSALEKVIREKMILTYKMFLVGSSVNGFGSLTSDIDLCLVVDARQEMPTNRLGVLNLLRDIQRLLQQAALAINLQVIPAKVPILKFKDALYGLDCDINVNSLIGIRNSELLRCYSNLDHRVRPLVLVVKEWARQNKINDASQGTLSSYSLVLMVIHFLQCGVQPRLLPSLQQKYPHIFTTLTPVSTLRGMSGRINPIHSENTMALFDLLLQFFEYFGRQFDFATQVVCVRLGTTRHVTNWELFAKDWAKPIKIEEPFDQSNTARAVRCPFTARRIIQQFSIAYDTLRTSRRLDCLITLRKSRDSIFYY